MGQSAQWTAFVSGKEDMKTKTGSGTKDIQVSCGELVLALWTRL